MKAPDVLGAPKWREAYKPEEDGEGWCGWGRPVTEGIASPALATPVKTQFLEKGSSVFHNHG